MIFASEAFVVSPLFCLLFAQTARMILSKRFNRCCGSDTGTNMFCTEQLVASCCRLRLERDGDHVRLITRGG